VTGQFSGVISVTFKRTGPCLSVTCGNSGGSSYNSLNVTGGLVTVLGSAGPQIVQVNPVSQNSGVVNGSVSVFNSEMFTVSGSLTIVAPEPYFPQLGSLLSFGGSIVLTQNANVRVSTNLYLDGGGGGLAVTLGHKLVIDNALIVENSTSVPLLVSVDTIPFNATQIVVVVANYSRMVGRFGSVSVTSSRRRDVKAVTDGGVTCVATIGQASADYGASSLVVIAPVTNECSSGAANLNSQLSTGAIVGICIGAVIGGLVIAGIVVVATKVGIAKHTASANAAIQLSALEDLRI
jgi:hypothetical protein